MIKLTLPATSTRESDRPIYINPSKVIYISELEQTYRYLDSEGKQVTIDPVNGDDWRRPKVDKVIRTEINFGVGSTEDCGSIFVKESIEEVQRALHFANPTWLEDQFLEALRNRR